MDPKDKKILALLDQNSRMQSSIIAKKLKMKRQTVEYRINNLDVILHKTTMIDPTKFYENIWHIYLKLQSTNGEIVDYLNKKKEVWWIAECQGEFDLIFSVCGNDIMEFDRIIQEFRAKFHQNIVNEHITSMIKAIMFPRGYFTNKETKGKEYIGKREKTKIDEKDLAILKILATQARTPATTIAQKTGLTARQVIYRIKNLMKNKVIKGFRLHLDFNKLGYDYYKVCFYAQEHDEKKVINWCENCPNTLYYIRKIAPWTFEIEFETKSYKELNGILKDFRNKFKIKRTTITLITKEHKGELNFLTNKT